MEQKLVDLIIGSLLHDVGKIVYRSGQKGTHSNSGWEFLSNIRQFEKNINIKECVKYHHGSELKSAKLLEDSLAYISYLADNISAASDRREEVIEGDEMPESKQLWNKKAALESIFNVLYNVNENIKYTYPLKTLNEINYANSNTNENSPNEYLGILIKLKNELNSIDINEQYINSILHLLESTTTFIPSSTKSNDINDISFYDHSKTTAAIASCIFYYLEGSNYKRELFEETESFYNKEAFLLYSFDMSGIQKYLYTVSGNKALKLLKVRSLYLEILLENIVDDLLDVLHLSRCNLLYSGGGHAYILLPNTENTINKLQTFENNLKTWFIEEFGISLFLASGYVGCTSNELKRDIGSIFKKVAETISENKSKRYTAEDILKLNDIRSIKSDRECKECMTTHKLNSDNLCDTCNGLIQLSTKISLNNMYFVVQDELESKDIGTYLNLPFQKVLTIKEAEEIYKMQYHRIYSINKPSVGKNFETNLWVGNYVSLNDKTDSIKSFKELADEALGIDRIVVFRADVDNLGRAFISGFSEKYKTLSRIATFSRQLSLFFKYYINIILSKNKRNAIIVYSGGDDLFIVGSWEDTIEIAREIYSNFKTFTQNKLTISGGLGIYNHSHPISSMAEEVGYLLDLAKNKDEKKNKVTLFRGKTNVFSDWILEWDELPKIKNLENIENINGIEDKLVLLREVFKKEGQSSKNILYNILELLRNSSDKINIARYAYLLGRQKEEYKELDVIKFNEFIKSEKDRKELEIAITLYSYETRD